MILKIFCKNFKFLSLKDEIIFFWFKDFCLLNDKKLFTNSSFHVKIQLCKKQTKNAQDVMQKCQ